MATPTEADAEAVYVIDINDMKSVFQFQTDSSGVNLLDVTSSNTSLRYYVDLDLNLQTSKFQYTGKF